MDILDDAVKDLANSLSDGSLISRVQSAVHDELNQVQNGADDAISTVDVSLKELLKAGVGGLDGEIQVISTDLTNLASDVDIRVQQDLHMAAHALAITTQKAHNRIGELVGQIEDSVIDTTLRIKQPTDQILDRTGWNIVGIGAGLLLVSGLLIAVAAVILTKGWPDGIGGLIAAVLLLAFVLFAGALTFVPAIKERILNFVDQDVQTPIIPPTPEIFNVEPNPVVVGSTGFPEVHIHGVHLTPGGQLPVVTITPPGVDTAEMAIRGAGDHQITFASPIASPRGETSKEFHSLLQRRVTVQLTLTYPDKTTVGCPLEVEPEPDVPAVNPAEIVINSLSFIPAQPTATQDMVHACVSLTNKGGTSSKPFQITWLPLSGNLQLTTTIPALPPDSQPHEFTLPTGYAYPAAGTFQTEVRSNSSEMGFNCAFIDSTIDVAAPPPPAQEEGAEYFIVSAHASAGLGFADATDIDFTYMIRDGWNIDRSRGDPGHEGIHEAGVNDNQQSKDTLRAYNYQPEGSTLVRVTGRIWGSDTVGSGAIFERIYRVNTIRTAAVQPPPPSHVQNMKVCFRTDQASEIPPDALMIKIARYLDQLDESIIASGIVTTSGYLDATSPDVWVDFPLNPTAYPKTIFDDYGIGISYDSSKAPVGNRPATDWYCHLEVWLWFDDGTRYRFELGSTQLKRGQYFSKDLPGLSYP